jgi:hypothetical protein
MAISIPSGAFDKYNEGADEMINSFGVTCQLVYPEKRTRCENCITNTMGGRSSNIYRSGGPISFPRGMPCPWCNGKGFLISESTEDIVLRVYWRTKDWIDVGFKVDVPANYVQTIGYIKDLPKIEKAKQLITNKDIKGYETWRFQRAGEGYPHGFKQNRYIINFWERI